MSLKKTKCGYIDKDGMWVEQRDVEMHPIEEAASLKDWEYGAAHNALPKKPSLEEEHEWLVEFGMEYVKQKRLDFDNKYNEMFPAVARLHQETVSAHNRWNSHVEKCLQLGVDPDTYKE